MKSLDFDKGALPLYVQLKEIILEDIVSGKYPYMTTIPAEIVFQNTYNVSRITVRQAISSLEQEGYVERSRGRGTRVIWRPGIDEDVNKLISLSDEFSQRNIDITTPIVHVSKEIPPANVQRVFGSDDVCLLVERLRESDGEPLVFFRTWIPADLGFPEKADAYHQSLYSLYEEVGPGKPVKARDTLSSELARNPVAACLEVKEGAPLLVRQRIGYNNFNRPIEYTESYFRGDRYRYHLDLSDR